MFRCLIAFPLIAAVVALAPTCSFGQTAGGPGSSGQTAGRRALTPRSNDKKSQKVIKLGEGAEGEITEDQKDPDNSFFYATTLRVALKAGQKLKISASVVGEGRRVGLKLFDPTGQLIRQMNDFRQIELKSTELKNNGVNAKGQYAIRIISDKIGPFSLVAVDPDAEEAESEMKTGTASSGIKFNETFEGELGEGEQGSNNAIGGPGGPGGRLFGGLGEGGYSMALPVALKAGQALTISASVTGTSRRIGITLLDSTGMTISRQQMVPQSAKLNVKQVNARGLGKIIVHSDKIGPFTLTVVDPDADDSPAEEPTAQMLRDKIKTLKAELEAAEKKLKAIESK